MNNAKLLPYLSGFPDFVRWKISVFLASLAVCGYLIFNTPGADLVFVILGALFISFGAYGCNTITDKEEDAINGRRNPGVSSQSGRFIVFFSFLFGVLFSLLLGSIPVIFALAAIVFSVAYSGLRLKKYLLIKNLYTGFTIPLSFVFGAMKLSPEVLQYYFSFFLFFLIGSIISDLRDYEGDRRAGIRTFPVYIGPEKTKKEIYFLIAALFFLFLKTNAYVLFPLIVSLPVTAVFVLKNRYHSAHLLMGKSLLFLAIWTAFN